MINTEIAIIGKGPAGLSASIYTARAGMQTTIIGCNPRIAGEYDVDNYFGFPQTISGHDLMARGMEQVKRFDADFVEERVLAIHHGEKGGFEIKTEHQEIHTCGLILSTGVSRTSPKIDNVDDYEGKGVSYCVSCDGFFFRNCKVIVIGEGLFAANQALELLQYTTDVSIYTQGKQPAITDTFLEKLKAGNIPIIEKKIEHLQGNKVVESAICTDGSKIDAEGIFVALGEASSTDFALSLGIVIDGSFITVDREQKTNIPGIFAAGDCTGGFLQISVAVGEGATAARSAIGHVKNICRE